MKINKKKKRITIGYIAYFVNVIFFIPFLLLIFLSHYFAVQNGYIIIKWELSELVLYGQLAKILFNTSMIIESFLLMLLMTPFILFLEEKISKILYSIIIAVVCLSLLFVGIFPEDVFFNIHYIFGAIFFIGITIFSGYMSIFSMRKLAIIPKYTSYIGFFSTFMTIFHLATRPFFGKGITQRLSVFFWVFYLMFFYYYAYFRSNTVLYNEKEVVNPD
ncbi:MAG: DUF998 domain-containing protein [Asgard group archaeon]|nr:DUF998 domain-containing protein [Asgard group archaeon]